MTDSSPDAAPAATPTDVPSAPSPETQDQGVGSLQDAVDAALGEQEPEAPPASDEPGSKDPVPESPEKAEEISEEEIERYSRGAQRRIRDLVEAKKSVEAEVVPLREELETVKPKAEQMDRLVGYMREHEISSEHLDNALGLTAMINKGEYQKAIPILESLIQQVKAAAGETLPDDLQERVKLGYIPEADAKRMHQLELAQKHQNERMQRQQAESQQRETQRVVATAVQTAETWHKEQQTSDPDWNLKRDFVVQRMEVEISRRMREKGPAGYPRSPEEVRNLLDAAKAEVEKSLKRFSPKPSPIDPPVAGNGASPRSQAKPVSLDDYVNQALARAAG
jgi:hypothetical protein